MTYRMIFVKSETCGFCKMFESEWMKIVNDPDINKNFVFGEVTIRGNQIPPEQLGVITAVPKLVVVNESEYQQVFDQSGRATSPVVLRNTRFEGPIKNHQNIKKWLIEKGFVVSSSGISSWF